MRKLFITTLLLGLALLLMPSFASAHPGNTDANGGHHCWTNCGYWGYDYGEYHYHYDESVYVDNEKEIRKQDYNAAVSEGEYLLKLLNNFNTAINSGDIKKIDGLYDQFTDQLSYVEHLIGYVYGSDNRSKLSQKYVKPSKIAKERTIYEVSQLRLLSQINSYINEDYDVSEEFSKLDRLVKKAAQIKKSGGYNALPNSVNNDLRYQEALTYGNYLNKKAYYFSQLIGQGDIYQINEEYDYFVKQIQITEAKIGKVSGKDNRDKLGNRFIKSAKVLKERTIYEVSQFRLLQNIENLYYSGEEKEARNNLSKLDRLKERAVAIKAAGGYKNLPATVTSDLKDKEDLVRYLLG
ncbi:YHYH domain-containing protein [Metabacillus fastidiosus]|uniref:YHYH domain-containing protein n=1 Tax=Metabacillus fastidiosus TaxID=1458 RepID=UPI003D26B955